MSLRPLPDEWQVTVQEPLRDEAAGIDAPGYVQVDKLAGGESRESTDPEQLAREGYEPFSVRGLRSGRYRVGDLRRQKRVGVAEAQRLDENGAGIEFVLHMSGSATAIELNPEKGIYRVSGMGLDEMLDSFDAVGYMDGGKGFDPKLLKFQTVDFVCPDTIGANVSFGELGVDHYSDTLTKVFFGGWSRPKSENTTPLVFPDVAFWLEGNNGQTYEANVTLTLVPRDPERWRNFWEDVFEYYGPDTDEDIAEWHEQDVRMNYGVKESNNPVRRAVACLLREGIVQGEYWIFDDGSVHYCDGDVGDVNHEAYALQHAQMKVLDRMNIDSDIEYLDRNEMLARIARQFEHDAPGEIRERAQAEQWDEFDIADWMAKEHKVDAHLLDAAFDRGDIRQYAMRHWGWHALRGDTAETWEITPESLQTIAAGILNALDETGVEPEEIDPDEEFWVDAYKGHRSERLVYSQLEAPDLGAEFVPPPAAPPEQVRQLDLDLLPTFYQGKFGDSMPSVPSAVDRLLEDRFG